MFVGICVEGTSDIEAIKAILTKLTEVNSKYKIRCEVRQYRGYPNLIHNLHQGLREFNKLYKADIITVIVDNDRNKRNQRFNEIAEKCEKELCGEVVVIGVAVEALEAWLLSDEKALSKIVQRTIRAIRNPENIKNPDVKLGEIVHINSLEKPYPEILKEIALNLNLKNVSYRCRSFNSFRESYVSKLKAVSKRKS